MAALPRRRPLRTYNTLASACSRGHAWVQASRFLNLAVDQGLPWDLFSYNIAIQVQRPVSHRSAGGSSLMMLLSTSEWRSAAMLGGHRPLRPCDSQLQRQGLEPNGVTFTAAIGACERAGRWELALDFLRRLRQAGPVKRDGGRVSPVGAITSNSVMAACATGHAWAEAVKDMLLAGTADAASLSNVLKAFRTTSQWQKAGRVAVLLFEAVQVADMPRKAASWHHYVSVAEACSLQSSWQQALWLLFHAAPPTDAADYRFSAAISACKNALVAGEGSSHSGAGDIAGGSWLALWGADCSVRPAVATGCGTLRGVPGTGRTNLQSRDGDPSKTLAYLGIMPNRQVPAITFGTFKVLTILEGLIRFCGARVCPFVFVQFFHSLKMPHATETPQDDPDVPAADGEFGAGGALISVFEKMAMWQSALQVFSQIQEPNRVDYVTTLLAVAGHAPEIAKDLYLQSPLPAQALRPLDTPGPGMTLDLHDMPVEVATLAVEVLLEDIDAGSQLVILTGHAQHRSVPGRVRQAVLSLLKTRPDVEVQEPEENQGMLICGIKR
eukprot:Skav215015  [mRNA]  locus=scaffold966:85245:89552:+ [translate_table: standard]